MESTHDSRIAYWDHEPRSNVALIINGLRTRFMERNMGKVGNRPEGAEWDSPGQGPISVNLIIGSYPPERRQLHRAARPIDPKSLGQRWTPAKEVREAQRGSHDRTQGISRFND